jgi:hypothetical protein
LRTKKGIVMNLAALCQSIRKGLMVEFNYGDKQRVVEVHAIGVTAKDTIAFRAWQLGDEEGWRMFDLEKLQSPVKVTDIETDGPRPGYKLGDSAMKIMILQQDQRELIAA